MTGMRRSGRIAMLLIACSASTFAVAATPVVELEIRDHLFFPAEIVVPAGIKIKLVIFNRDTTPEEFESYPLNREKLITGGGQAVVFIGPLEPGEYPFFGEFFPKTAQGVLIALPQEN